MKKHSILMAILVMPLFVISAQYIEQIPVAATPGVLTVTATESTAGGNYAPRHLNAIWIQDNSGRFVKTLLSHAASFKYNLTNWERVTIAFGSRVNTVDAIVGATRNVYETHTCTWNGTDLATPRAVVPDGTYTVHIELTDKNSTGNYASFTFVKGTNSVDLKPANQNGFSNVSIKWVPSLTAIVEVKLEKMYTISPNPVKSSFVVRGADVSSIELFTITGKKIISTNESKMNISALAKGNYIAIVSTKKGKFSKKIIKQ